MMNLLPISAAASLATVLMISPAAAQSDPSTASASEPSAGEKAFQARCARCHKSDDLKPYLTRNSDAEVARRTLDAFLSRHHGGSDETRAAIIAYMLALPR